VNQPQPPAGEVSTHTFSADFLHDLRTPLNHIIGYSELLTEQAQEEGQQGFVPDLQKIRAAGQQMLDLLNSGMSTSHTAGAQDDQSVASRANTGIDLGGGR
jgi:signal transduction histidine kinase